MSNPTLRDLPPLQDGEPVWGIMPSKLSDKDLQDLADEAYACPKAMLIGALLGFLAWGVIFFIGWLILWGMR